MNGLCIGLLRYHDTYREYAKSGVCYHIDLGYVDPKFVHTDRCSVTHLMLDKWTAPEFIAFVKERRRR
jgi:hypothetical protein